MKSERQVAYGITDIWNLNHDTSEIIYKNRNRLPDIENKFVVTKVERGWGVDKLRVWN